jgi:hypothetical protein
VAGYFTMSFSSTVLALLSPDAPASDASFPAFAERIGARGFSAPASV